MRLRLAFPPVALLLAAVCLPGAALAAPASSTGGAVAVDEPSASLCPSTDDPAVAQASAVRALLRITSRPSVAGRRVSVDTELASSGCLTLTLYPRRAKRLDAATRIGFLVRSIADGGPTRSVVALNARGRRLLAARHGVAATLITDFRTGPAGAGAQVTLSTPLWL